MGNDPLLETASLMLSSFINRPFPYLQAIVRALFLISVPGVEFCELGGFFCGFCFQRGSRSSMGLSLLNGCIPIVQNVWEAEKPTGVGYPRSGRRSDRYTDHNFGRSKAPE